jgi:hypothetical protein
VKKIFFLFIISAAQTKCAQNAGMGITTLLARLHVANSAVLFTNNTSVFPNNPISFAPPPIKGKGLCMIWYPQKAAFSLGRLMMVRLFKKHQAVFQ